MPNVPSISRTTNTRYIYDKEKETRAEYMLYDALRQELDKIALEWHQEKDSPPLYLSLTNNDLFGGVVSELRAFYL